MKNTSKIKPNPCKKCGKYAEHFYKTSLGYVCSDCLVESEKEYKAKKTNNGYFTEKET